VYLCLALAAVGAPKTPQAVSDIRFWVAGDTTRVAIEVSGEFTYKSQRLSGPDRVFFDIEPAKLALKGNKPSTMPVNNGLVKQVRFAEKQPGTIRVVLDLEDGVEFTASQLSNPERLMVELRAGKKSKAAPAVTSSAAPVPQEAPAPAAAKVEEEVLPKNLLIPPVFATMSGASATPPPISAKVVAPSQIIKVTPAEPVKLPEPVKEAARTAAVAEPSLAPSPSQAQPKAASRNSNGERSLTRVLGLKLGRVVLDPGHGGHDQGTKSKSGLLEKDLVLDVSKRLAELLKERMGADVVLTRDDDTYLSLEERTRLANQEKADLFLSIHANSSPAKNVAGVETFYLNFSTGREDLDLATRENAASERSIGDLKEVVSKIALRAKVDESREFALRIQNSLHSAAVKQNKEAKDRGVKRAPFVVLIGADMPSVLAEIGFLTNSKDETLLKSEEHRDRIAEALYQGIASYAESLSRSGQQLARK
jgi:N-acetylmuramoyl-L-alanine amidase